MSNTKTRLHSKACKTKLRPGVRPKRPPSQFQEPMTDAESEDRRELEMIGLERNRSTTRRAP